MIYSIECIAILTIAPILLIPVEKILPYPYFVEEIVKFFLVRKLARKKHNHWHVAIVGGLLFTITESFLYLPNIINSGGGIVTLLHRLLFTGILHCGTSVGMFFGNRKSNFWGIFSLVVAMTIHYLFNWFWLNVFTAYY